MGRQITYLKQDYEHRKAFGQRQATLLSEKQECITWPVMAELIHTIDQFPEMYDTASIELRLSVFCR